MLRTNLASVILQLSAAELGDISDFPFLDAPDRGQITDGLRLLEELGALDRRAGQAGRLTAVGRRLAQLPVDPRLGRMLLAGDRHGCLREVLVIVSALAIQDPRERPAEHRDQADALHRRFWAPVDTEAGDAGRSGNEGSDFLALLRLWDYLRQAQRSLSGNAFRRLCRAEFIHFLRVREWQDLHSQLKDVSRELGLNRNSAPAPPDQVHTAILSGLLSHVGLADVRAEAPAAAGRRRRAGPREYLGARNTRFALNPASALAKNPPPLVMAAEIVETTRLWARTVAGVTAGQIEEVGDHLLKRTYAEPHWSARHAAVRAYETVTLYGIPVIARRSVAYAKINRAEAREIFIRSALVEGEWRTRHHFLAANAAIRAEAEQLEERSRGRGVVVDDQVVFDFYAARIPPDVSGGAEFDAWWKHARKQTPRLLTLSLDDLVVPDAAAATKNAFPGTWRIGEHQLAVRYRFQPGDPHDGVSVKVPVAILNQVDAAPFTWQVPGLRTELATELIRSLPKQLRRNLGPAPDVATRALAWLRNHPGPAEESFPAALSRALRVLTGDLVPVDAWEFGRVPAHLRPTFLITDGDLELASGKDLDELNRRLAPQLAETLDAAAREHTQRGLTEWSFGPLPAQVELVREGHRVIGHPALVDEGTSVGVAVLETPERQRSAHERGLRRLVLLNTPDPTKWVVAHLTNIDRLALGTGPYPSAAALLADARLASVGELIRRHGGEVWDESSFRTLCDAVRAENPDLMRALVGLAAEILRRHSAVRAELPRVEAVSAAAAADISEQIGNLVFPGFLSATAYEHLGDLPRYMQAAKLRIDTLLNAPARDRPGFQIIAGLEDAYADVCALAPPGPLPDAIEAIGWQLEELRVSLFAQHLRTKAPVSEKRVRTAIAEARAGLGSHTAGVAAHG